MESIIENLSQASSLFDVWLTKIVGLENETGILNNRLDITSGLINKLADNISQVNEGISLRSALITRGYIAAGSNPGKDFFEYGSDNISQDQQYRSENEGDFLKGVKIFTKLTDAMEKTSGAFEGLSPGIKRIHTIIKAVHGISEGAEGVSGLVSFAENGTLAGEGIADGAAGIATGGELLTGAAGIAEAGAAFGPPGWAVGSAALIAAGVISKVTAQDESIKMKNENSVKLQQKSMAAFVMSEPDATMYIEQAKHLPKEHQHVWTAPYDAIKENVAKYGADAYSLNYQIPTQVIDNNRVQQNLLPRTKQSEDVIPVKQSYLEQTFDLQQRLYNAAITKGRDGFNEAALQAITGAKNYDKIHHTDKTGITASAISEELNSLLNDANNGKIISGNTIAPNRYAANQNAHGKNTSNKPISININKPLIENFIINTKEVKEGLSDFKHKVEEVLLEILNSANAIH